MNNFDNILQFSITLILAITNSVIPTIITPIINKGENCFS